METKVVKKPYDFVGCEGRHIVGSNYYLVCESPLGSVSLKIEAKGLEKKILEKVIEEQDNK